MDQKDVRRNNKFKKDKRKPVPSSKSSNQKTSSEVPPKPTTISLTEDEDDKYFSKREIVSNSSRYDLQDEEENEQMLAADFSELLNAPQSTGGHFQFSNEKSWTTNLVDTNNRANHEFVTEETNKYFHQFFNLNLSRLNDSIITIPFYERLGLDRELFTDDELKMMAEKAKKLEENYKRLHQKDVTEVLVSNSSVPSKEIKQPEIEPKTVKSGKSLEIDLDELLEIVPVSIKQNSITSKSKVKEPVNTLDNDQTYNEEVKKESSEDMQKWLDDVLND